MTPNNFLAGRRREAFTLIELLVVISIIAVLAGLLLPVVNKVTENARKVSAKATEMQVVAAVNNYMAEYGQYPVYFAAAATVGDKTYDGSSGNETYILFNVLRALNTDQADVTSGLNSRRIPYFEAKNVKNVTVPRDGFIVTPPAQGGSPNGKTSAYKAGDLVDPWGNEYSIRIDSNYTSAVVNPYSEGKTPATDKTDQGNEKVTDPSVIRTGVIAWSYGTDGKTALNGTAASTPYTALGDDVVSWQ